MKNLKIYILVLSTIAFYQCSDFLEGESFDSVTEANFYKTAEDAESAVNSAYEPLRGIVESYPRVLEFPTEMVAEKFQEGVLAATDQFITQSMAGVSDINDYWILNYRGILFSNIVLDKVPSIEMDSDQKNRILGEARFLRAFYYFNLVRTFGQVPLILKSQTSFTSIDEINTLALPRDEVDKIYDQIFEDFEFAELNLLAKGEYDNSDVGRVSKEAASAYLAKVYLQLGDFVNARSKALEVIRSDAFSLVPTVKDLWNSSGSTEEYIFEVQYSEAANLGRGIGAWAPTESTGVLVEVSAFSQYVAELYFYNSFSDADARKEATFLTEFVTSDGDTSKFHEWEIDAPHYAKFLTKGNPPAKNFAFLRYADILLIAAESINEQDGPGQAYQYINQVRERAGLIDLTNLSQQQFRDSVFIERRKELCVEGHAYFDGIRTGKLEFVVEASSKFNEEFNEMYPDSLFAAPRGVDLDPSIHYVMPVPGEQIIINPNLLPQNSGY